MRFFVIYIDLVSQLYTLLLLDIVQPAEPFLKPNILWYAQNSQWVQNSIFPNVTSLILCKFKFGYSIFQFIFTFKIGIFEFWVLGCTSNFFIIHKNIENWNLLMLLKLDFTIFSSDGILEFLNVSLGCTSKILPIH